jgi:hypothetical protein
VGSVAAVVVFVVGIFCTSLDLVHDPRGTPKKAAVDAQRSKKSVFRS